MCCSFDKTLLYWHTIRHYLKFLNWLCLWAAHVAIVRNECGFKIQCRIYLLTLIFHWQKQLNTCTSKRSIFKYMICHVCEYDESNWHEQCVCDPTCSARAPHSTWWKPLVSWKVRMWPDVECTCSTVHVTEAPGIIYTDRYVNSAPQRPLSRMPGDLDTDLIVLQW
jgi:hypothetical protein